MALKLFKYMIFIEKFFLPSESSRVYPYRILYSKMLDVVSFTPVTIFYGSNGSGKSTLLNVIAEKMDIRHKTLGNSSPYFDDFVKECAFEMTTNYMNSRFIRSEDVMEAIAKMRHETKDVINEIRKLQGSVAVDKVDGTKYNLMGENEMRIVMQKYNELPDQYSNGETAMLFFKNIFEPDSLYMLDEPENSLSPRLQLSLKELIEKWSYQLNCQFIIATHSPFLLSIKYATVYNLDHCPSDVCNWSELENMRTYYDFFKENMKLFEKNGKAGN